MLHQRDFDTQRGRSQSQIRVSNGEYDIVISQDDGQKTLRATRDGELVYEGTVAADEDWTDAPAEVRELVERMKISIRTHAPKPAAEVPTADGDQPDGELH